MKRLLKKLGIPSPKKAEPTPPVKEEKQKTKNTSGHLSYGQLREREELIKRKLLIQQSKQ